MQTEELPKTDNNKENQDNNSQDLYEDMNSPQSKINPENEDNLNPEKNKETDKDGEEIKLKPSAYSSTQKNKSRILEENKEISDFTTNKKFRNTMPSLNSNKLKFKSGLIDVILKVERENVNHYLKGDLAEMYKDINKDYTNFKNNVFLANIDYFEKRSGNMDKNPKIPYNCSEDVSYKLDKYPTTNEIIDKFAERTKNYQGDI